MIVCNGCDAYEIEHFRRSPPPPWKWWDVDDEHMIHVCSRACEMKVNKSGTMVFVGNEWLTEPQPSNLVPAWSPPLPQKVFGLTHVYFIQEGAHGPIKIGFSVDPRARLAALQTCNPRELRLIGLRPGSKEDERALHDRFAAQRVRGEWFYPGEELLAVAKGAK